jgi:hypothetical protein
VILKYTLNEKLPKLAWIARTDRSNDIIHIEHGKFVECNDNWMVEGVWDGDFKKGNFHKSYNFFGSGLRIDGDFVYFVPSSALVDRLIFCEIENDIIVSNSLILLLARTGATLDENHNYLRESLSILRGINRYDKQFRVLHPKIEYFKQIFAENLIVSKTDIFFDKRMKLTKISTYEQYFDLLKKIIDLIGVNYRDENRKVRVDAFSTISKGYDSTAVSSLVKDIGVKTAFTGKRPINITPFSLKRFLKIQDIGDDGTLPAKALGLNIKYLDTEKSNIAEDELYFLSTNYPKFASISREPFWLDGHRLPRPAHWAELSHYSMASFIEDNCSVAVVFTGYHGGRIWGKKLEKKYLVDDIIRGDVSGLNLTEIRLKSGFINVPVPFILASNIVDINKIANSDEMKPWSLNRNDYDRPIARRIAENAGVNRNLFGINKKFIANNYFYPVNKKLRREFFAFIKENYGVGRGFIFIYLGANFLAGVFYNLYNKAILNRKRGYNYKFWKQYDFYFMMNHWAIQALTRKYQNVFKDDYKPSI